MKRDNLISHASVSRLRDLRLLDLGPGRFDSRFYARGPEKNLFTLEAEPDRFYPEICLLCTVRAENAEALFRDEAVFVAARDPETGNGWQLDLDQYGYLCFRGTGDYRWLYRRSRLALPCFVENAFRVGFALDCSRFRLTLLAAADPASAPRPVAALAEPFVRGDVEPEFTEIKMPATPVCRTISVPLAGAGKRPLAVREVSAWNSSRYEAFVRPAPKPGAACRAGGGFPGASRVFPFYDRRTDTLELFTGPEFTRTTSYWVFTRVTGARPGKTRVRLHFTEQGEPNMHPVIFYSRDRRAWARVRTLEAAAEDGRFDPLVLAPAREFYLASSIPFMLDELAHLEAAVSGSRFVKILTVGHSVEARPIKLFRVTDPTVPAAAKKHLALIAGQHSPQEMLGAHFLAPMIDHLVRHPGLLKKMVLYFVPIVNMDCAAWGGNGMNLNGCNLNRHWANNAQPENRGIRDYFLALRRRGLGLDVFLDLHAGGTFRNHPLFRHAENEWRAIPGADAAAQAARQERFLELLDRHAGIRREDGWSGSLSSRGRLMACGYFQYAFPAALSYTLELSTSSYFDPVSRRNRTLDQASLTVVGAGILKAFLRYAGLEP